MRAFTLTLALVQHLVVDQLMYDYCFNKFDGR
jgi:hypothetical protein